MKKVIVPIYLIVVTLTVSCTKKESVSKPAEADAGRKATRTVSGTEYVTSIKYTQKMVFTPSGKYDCTKKGNDCNVKKEKSHAQVQELAVLENHISEKTIQEYFHGDTWQILFPEITERGVAALLDGKLHIYKMESIDDTVSYVLSSSPSSNAVSDDNIISVWQY